MRAAIFSEYGGPEVLRVSEVDTPRAGAGQVRVRVRAAGVQPYDLAVRAGWTPPGVTTPLPRIPGNEFAGVVDEVGAGVTGVSAGDEVLGFGQLRAYAEYVVVPSDHVTPKPEAMPWEVAGGFTAGAQTASLALEALALSKADTLVVHGAAGAVGTMAVQLAAREGARVIGTAAPDNHDYLRELGATPVAYGPGLVSRLRPFAPTVALDGAGGAALDASLELVADRRRILTLVDHERAASLGVRVVEGVRSASRLASLADLYAKGELRVHVRSTYPLERAPDAHRELEKGHGRGKIVLLVAPSSGAIGRGVAPIPPG
jgi:NADPH:quinone reductase-like Zn-dependent oxidoreductase